MYGVIFLFKYPTGEKPSDTPRDGSFDRDASENLFFAAQTIQNACGTQALLSVLLNKEAEVQIGPQLKDFKEFTGAFPSEVGPPLKRTYPTWTLIRAQAARRSALELRVNKGRPQLLRTIVTFRRRNPEIS